MNRQDAKDLKSMLGSLTAKQEVEKINPHAVKSDQFANDIALLELKIAVDDAENVLEMQIPTEGDKIQEGAEYEFIGWGRLNVGIPLKVQIIFFNATPLSTLMSTLRCT